MRSRRDCERLLRRLLAVAEESKVHGLHTTEVRGLVGMVAVLEWELGHRQDADLLVQLALAEVEQGRKNANRPEEPDMEARVEMGPAQRFFDAAWKRLERFGGCDAFGSAEYERVLREWIAADLPDDVWTFIVQRGNLPHDLFFSKGDPQVNPNGDRAS